MMRLSTSVLVATLVLVGCSKPTDVVIPSDVATWDDKLVPEVKKLNDSDREKFTAFLIRAKFGEAFGGNGIPPGTTIGEAIDEQTKWAEQEAIKRAEEEALKKKLEQERAAAIDKLNKAVTVTLLAKRELPVNFSRSRYSPYQEFRIGAQNNTDQIIVGVSGDLMFIDVFDKEVTTVSFAISESIDPSKTAIWTGGRDFNQFIDSHRALWNLEEGKYTTKFIPEMIVFKDGSKLSIPK